MMEKKKHFLEFELIPILAAIPPDTKPVFGKMNLHQMIEHLGYAFQQASGLIPALPAQDEATTEKMFRFMMSDKPFRDNTPNPMLPDEPLPPQGATIAASLEDLHQHIQVFVATFQENPERRILNPFFGNLNFEEWVHLLHKHMFHHLRQFNSLPQHG
jgi:hypothetical protein